MAAKSSSGLPLAVATALIVLAAVALAVGGGALVSQRMGVAAARGAIDEVLAQGHSAHILMQQQRHRQLQLMSRIFSTDDELLTRHLAEAVQQGDTAAVIDLTEEYQNLLSFDLAVVLDRSGQVIVRTDDPQSSGDDLSSSALFTAARDDKQASGLWLWNGRLHHAAAVQLARRFELVGYIIIALGVDDTLAQQLERASGAETAFLVDGDAGPSIVATTLDDRGSELLTALRRDPTVLHSVTRDGRTLDHVELALGEAPSALFLTPLRDAAGGALGAIVLLTRPETFIAGYRQITWTLIGLGLVGLVLGTVAAVLTARRAQRPVRRLAAAAAEIARGNYEPEVPSAPGAAGGLASALGGLRRELRERRIYERFIGRASRHLPEPATESIAVARPQAVATTLVAVEMTRFADPKLAYDAEESAGRFGRDLRRIETAAAAQGGGVAAVLGHRILLTFDGEGTAVAALGAAAEILRQLSERESVFDEPSPPVVALTAGSVVEGAIAWSGRAGTLVAGLPIQQLESLLREAAAGDVYLARPIYEQIAPAAQRAGVEIRQQRGLLSPQPLYLLTAEAAARAAGVEPAEPAATAAGFPGERRALADVVPGSVLGGRFDVLAELGSGALGIALKAFDREQGELVTLKMVRPEVVADGARFERLREVIQRARRVEHPHILQVRDFAETDSLPYILVEYARGPTLRALLDVASPVSPHAGQRIARQAAMALASAHDQGLHHLGFKPENVLLETAGAARVMDFGLAAAGSASGLVFQAPEQLAGEPGDERSDVFALGVVLYQMLAGKPPWAAANAAELRRAREATPPDELSVEVPEELARVTARCLNLAAEERPGMAEVVADLSS